MHPRLHERFQRVEHRLAELDAALADPVVTADISRLRALTREHAQAAGLVDLYHRHQRCERDLAQAREWLADPELADMAREEIERGTVERQRIEDALLQSLLPVDPDDGRNAFLEIRAGTGGDESALFAADLVRMYLRYCERQGWRAETISASPSDLGGYREIVLRIEGDGVFGRLRHESGGHRVQRIPQTESQGRIHTSACTVAVMPEPDESDEIALNPADLRIDTFRASGAGGQHVNKTDSAIRITHLPTGLVAECQDDRSQHRNKARAMAVLTARLRERERAEREAREAATRRSLVGTGDRSDRIRTYNFPQGRLTDHRIGLTLHKLGAVMDGDLGDVIEALAKARAAEALAAMDGRGSDAPVR
jgi:peptide chain release factor 1